MRGLSKPRTVEPPCGRRLFECGMLPPRTQGYSSLLVQRRVTRRKDTPDGANTPTHPRLWGPRLTHATSCRGIWSRTSMSATPAGRFPKALRCLGAPYGDPKKTRARTEGEHEM